MKPYKQTQTLSTLTQILAEIISKEGGMQRGNEYNRKCAIAELRIDVEKLRLDRDNLKYEYNELILTLKLK